MELRSIATRAEEQEGEGESFARQTKDTKLPELVHRIQDVVPFTDLGAEALGRVLRPLQSGLNDQLGEKGLEVVLSEALRAHLIDAGLNARPLQRHLDRMVRDVLVDHLFAHEPRPDRLALHLEGSAVVVRRTGGGAAG